jgi:hypothetical protein
LLRILHVRDVLQCGLPPRGKFPAGGGVEIDRVSFRGLVLEKGFRTTSIGSTAAGAVSSSGSGGGSSMRGWWLLVCDVEYAHTVVVHMLDIASYRCLVGALVPGSVAIFRRCRRMLSHNCSIHIEVVGEGAAVELEACMHLTDADALGGGGGGGGPTMHSIAAAASGERQARARPDAAAARTNLRVALHTHFPLKALPLSFNSQLPPFAPSLSALTLHLRVRISSLSSFVLRRYCSGCERMLTPEALRCAPRPSPTVGGGVIRACAAAEPFLHASASLVVDDGTGLALLYISGPQLVLEGLLAAAAQFSARERRNLADIARHMGCFEYYRSNAADATEEQQEAEWSDRAAAAASLSASAARDVSELRLRSIQASVWQRRLRDALPGTPLQLCATQFTVSRIMQQAASRAARAIASAAANAATGAGRSSRASSFVASAPTAGGAALLPAFSPALPPSRFPFEMCQPRMLQIDKMRIETLQPPLIYLRAVSLQNSSAKPTGAASPSLAQKFNLIPTNN